VVIDCGGIGYKTNVSLNTYSKIEKEEAVFLFISEVPRIENQSYSGMELYGFHEESERELFENLIFVSGVGASTARIMLSTYKPDEIKAAISTENESLIQSIKGIGPKTAKRIILELKDKVSKHAITGNISGGKHNNNREEALSALLALGFARNAAEKALDQAASDPNINGVEGLIKKALKLL
jgi:Holliday junction DNA helicase RuvA